MSEPTTGETPKPTLTPSWSLVPKSFALLQQYFEPVVIISVLPLLTIDLGSLLLKGGVGLGFLVSMVGLVWTLLTIAAQANLQVSAARGKRISVSECYNQSWRYYWRLLGFGLLFTIMLMIGFILLIVPFFILLRRYFLSPYYIVDQNLSITEAMKRSAAQTKPTAGYVWGTLGVFVVLAIAVGIVSAIFAGIPGLPTVIDTLLSLPFYFLFVLRYTEIAH